MNAKEYIKFLEDNKQEVSNIEMKLIMAADDAGFLAILEDIKGDPKSHMFFKKSHLEYLRSTGSPEMTEIDYEQLVTNGDVKLNIPELMTFMFAASVETMRESSENKLPVLAKHIALTVIHFLKTMNYKQSEGEAVMEEIAKALHTVIGGKLKRMIEEELRTIEA